MPFKDQSRIAADQTRQEELASHTPGPWSAKDGYVWSNPIGSNLVACCNKLGKQELANANARLIAAAPDMYEALIEMTNLVDWFLEAYQDEISLHGKEETQTKVQKARVAIAKARGQS